MESSRRFGPTPEKGAMGKIADEIAEQDNIIGLHEIHTKYLEEQHEAELLKHDIEGLTGLKTRKVFERELEGTLKIIRGDIQEKRTHVEPIKEVSLILIDLDYFKKVNDTFGHPAGDEVLRKVSEILIESERASDTAARFGGEELVVLMPGASVEVAARHAEDVRSKIEELLFAEYPELRITASFGVISSKVSTDEKVLLQKVDEALYEAKNNGRNQVKIYAES